VKRKVHATCVGIVANFPQLISVFLLNIVIRTVTKGDETVRDPKGKHFSLIIFFEEELEIEQVLM
jgi:hypothetical protein